MIGTRSWTSLAAAAMIAGSAALGALSLRPAGNAEAACCYFAAQEKDINQPGQKAFITWDPAAKIESWTVQPKFEGNAVDFGMVIPSPSQPKLDEMPRDFFKDLAIYSILMPLPEPIWLSPRVGVGGGSPQKGGMRPGADEDKKHEAGRGVTVLEAGVVGSLDYKIITAERAEGLYGWLRENQYVYSGDEGTLDFYIRKKWFFTVMKIDPRQMKKAADGSYLGEVTPTRFTFASDACVYPLKITQLSVKDKTDALFYVQAPRQMDLQGDLSWMHSYRVMYLTFLLGCGANAEQKQELSTRQAWVVAKRRNDPGFETTKLEWSRMLGEADLAVLDDPLKNYAQMGMGTLPEGHAVTSLEDFLRTARTEMETNQRMKPEDVASRLKVLEAQYASSKGVIVKISDPNRSFNRCEWEWWPHREAPEAEVKDLARLKGHLQQGQWLTKFRKIIRKSEMSDDLLLTPVPEGREQEYIRIMPTSPP
ncbi:MAG: DUF2330 domain-containing protein [Candidatus Brocadiae bacterium]|nr:DUF2330 domain-containing protein [Candidatus Brocadiia bacterium]